MLLNRLFLSTAMMLSNFYLLCASQLAKLTEEDMSVVHNFRMLGGQPVAKKSKTSGFGLKFEIHKVMTVIS